MYSIGKITCRPSRSAKETFREKLKAATSRKLPGTFKTIVTRINQITRGWINYYGIGSINGFLRETNQWLKRRVRQLIWKRWKHPRTKYQHLRKLGINHDEAMKTANSRKGYWRIAKSETLHRALSNKRLAKWGLIDLVIYYKSHGA